VLIFIFFQKPVRNWELITDVTNLFFSNVLLPWFISILGPLARNGLPPLLITTVHRSSHVDLERKILAHRGKVWKLHHVDLWEGLCVNLHRVLVQDQSALLNSQLNLTTQLLAFTRGMSE